MSIERLNPHCTCRTFLIEENEEICVYSVVSASQPSSHSWMILKILDWLCPCLKRRRSLHSVWHFQTATFSFGREASVFTKKWGERRSYGFLRSAPSLYIWGISVFCPSPPPKKTVVNTHFAVGSVLGGKHLSFSHSQNGNCMSVPLGEECC